MAKYLLACTCGKEIVVDVAQAGGQASCDCGASLAVPTLRNLRHLPPVAAEPAEAASPTWSLRHGLVALAIIAACAAAAVGGFFWWTSPVVPQYDSELYLGDVESRLEKLSPVEAWSIWLSFYDDLDKQGFAEFHASNTDQIEAAQLHHRRISLIAIAAAGVCLIAALAISALPKATQT
jgi:hypothetical protein